MSQLLSYSDVSSVVRVGAGYNIPVAAFTQEITLKISSLYYGDTRKFTVISFQWNSTCSFLAKNPLPIMPHLSDSADSVAEMYLRCTHLHTNSHIQNFANYLLFLCVYQVSHQLQFVLVWILIYLIKNAFHLISLNTVLSKMCS